MAKSKPKKKSQENPKDIDSLKSDVASFASSLGLASSSLSATSGFNDSDFRKTGPLKPNKKIQKPKLSNPSKTPQNKHNEKTNKHKSQHPKVQPSPVETEISNSYSKGFDKFKNLPKLPLVKASSLGIWYEDLDELEPKVIGEGKKVEAENAEELKRLADTKKKVGERLLFQYTRDFLSTEGKRGDIKRLLNLQGKSLTSMDKVSANVVLVEENPIANMSSLDKLLVMVTSKAGKRHALTAFDALRELFTSRLLPDRKLKTLLQRPVNHLPDSKDGNSLLLFWYWEECLKERYYSFIVALEEASRDMLPVLKDKASKSIYSLLKSKPEEERRLLSALINKLGDPQSKGASNADFHLSNLLAEHPYMQSVVIDEVDSFLFRPHLGLQSKYHAVNFLSQVRLSHKGDGPKVAKRLIDVYFALFKVLISEASGGQKTDKRSRVEDKKTSNSYKDSKDKNSAESHVEMDSRLLSALLTGVNRAFPFVSSNEADDIIEIQTPMLFQLVHSENFNVGIQALMLLDKISSKNQVVSDRYYRALYSKILLPAAMNTSKEDMFIGLLLRAMKTDVNLKRVSAFSKRLLQVALQQPPQYACGCLFLLSEVLKARPPLWNMVLQNESNDDDLEHFEDIVDETENESRTASKKSRITKGFVHESDIVKADGNSSEDENVAATSYSEDDVPDKGEDLVMTDSQKPADVNGHQPPVPNLSPSLPGGYNPRHREPSYCNADRVSWWELMVLASHVHPSVATMASTLLSGAHIVYNGNPLKDLSMTAFLDKFMEKKAKTSTWHGASQIEPAKQLDMSSSHLIGPEILLLAEGDVNPEDLVFHKFYAHKMSSTKKPKKKKKRGAEDEAAEDLYGMDDDGGGDESDNEEIDDMLDSVNPTVETSGDYDYDDLDQIANEDDDDLLRDDDDLVGDLSDAELDIPSDIGEGEDIDVATADGDWSDDDEDGISIGDADDGSGEDDDGIVQLNQKKRKRKSGGSVFASAEDYEHLINQDLTNEDSSPAEKAPVRRKKPKSAEKAPERRQNPKLKQQKKKKKKKKKGKKSD